MRVTYSISARPRVYTVVFKKTLPGVKCETWLKPFIPLSFDLMFINPSGRDIASIFFVGSA